MSLAGIAKWIVRRSITTISHRLAPRVRRKPSHAIVANADKFAIMQKMNPMLSLIQHFEVVSA